MPISRRDFMKTAGILAAGISLPGCSPATNAPLDGASEILLINGKIATQSARHPFAEAILLRGGRVAAVGSTKELYQTTTSTTVIDLNKRTAIPGLNDSHLHIIRGGLNYNLELQWNGVPSLSDALRMLKQQAQRTPPPQWVRVVGGFNEFQFRERRLPTLKEINEAAPDTPVFILHLYDRALLNRAALRAVGYNKRTKEIPGTIIEREKNGEPTGLLIANPNAAILYKTLAAGPKLPYDYQLNSTQHFMREMNRLGLTSCCDAGGGFQNYPDDYKVISELGDKKLLTVRIAYNLFTQNPGREREDFSRWIKNTDYRQGNDYLRLNGAGEMLVYSAADFEDFRVPRPEMPEGMESDLKRVVETLAAGGWPFRLHATYDETISRALSVFEEVNKSTPLTHLRWFFDHCETVTDANLERIKALGGGIAIQNRMAFQGEYFVQRYGRKAAERTPPIGRMLAMGIPVGAGTDGTRVSSYNPWISLYWLITGRTVGGLSLYPEGNRISREKALELFTKGSAFFSRDEERKGSLEVGQLADLSVLSEDYFSIHEERIRSLYSVLTIVGGEVVYAAEEFRALDKSTPRPMPDWSPQNYFDKSASTSLASLPPHTGCCSHLPLGSDTLSSGSDGLGCSCAVF